MSRRAVRGNVTGRCPGRVTTPNNTAASDAPSLWPGYQLGRPPPPPSTATASRPLPLPPPPRRCAGWTAATARAPARLARTGQREQRAVRPLRLLTVSDHDDRSRGTGPPPRRRSAIGVLHRARRHPAGPTSDGPEIVSVWVLPRAGKCTEAVDGRGSAGCRPRRSAALRRWTAVTCWSIALDGVKPKTYGPGLWRGQRRREGMLAAGAGGYGVVRVGRRAGGRRRTPSAGRGGIADGNGVRRDSREDPGDRADRAGRGDCRAAGSRRDRALTGCRGPMTATEPVTRQRQD